MKFEEPQEPAIPQKSRSLRSLGLFHVRLRTPETPEKGQSRKVKVNEDTWRHTDGKAARVHAGLAVTLRGPLTYTLWKLNLTSFFTVTGHSA